MKNKPFYIIAAFLITALVLIGIEIRHQKDIQQIAVLTQQNEALQQEIFSLSDRIVWDRLYAHALEDEIAQLTNEIEHIKAQQTKSPEAQKTNRGGERPHYALTAEERNLVERVVMAESGGESYEGQMLVCQCILNACEIDGIRPTETVKKYVYAKGRPKPTESVVKAVSAVFDKGEQVTDEAIVYFYAPAVVRSKFHESQKFTLEHGGHKFFCARQGR